MRDSVWREIEVLIAPLELQSRQRLWQIFEEMVKKIDRLKAMDFWGAP